MANTRLYRTNIRFDMAEPEASTNWSAPTSAQLNSTLVYNVTCALWEADTSYALGDSDVDNGLTFCSTAGVAFPTFFNPAVKFSALRDYTRNATGVFNGTYQRLAYPDDTYYILKRIGKASNVAYAAGDIVSIISAKTDIPVDNVGSKDNIRATQTFLPAGFVNYNYTLLT